MQKAHLHEHKTDDGISLGKPAVNLLVQDILRDLQIFKYLDYFVAKIGQLLTRL